MTNEIKDSTAEFERRYREEVTRSISCGCTFQV
jgi:hypothetical protein